MFLKLYATFSSIKYRKLYFNYFCPETKSALSKIESPRNPYNDKEFWAFSNNVNSYKSLLGNYVEVGVKVINYKFTDKQTDELIEGVKFMVSYVIPTKF